MTTKESYFVQAFNKDTKSQYKSLTDVGLHVRRTVYDQVEEDKEVKNNRMYKLGKALPYTVNILRKECTWDYSS